MAQEEEKDQTCRCKSACRWPPLITSQDLQRIAALDGIQELDLIEDRRKDRRRLRVTRSTAQRYGFCSRRFIEAIMASVVAGLLITYFFM
jgi:hypothetical protein